MPLAYLPQSKANQFLFRGFRPLFIAIRPTTLISQNLNSCRCIRKSNEIRLFIFSKQYYKKFKMQEQAREGGIPMAALLNNLNNQEQDNMNPEAAIRAISMIFAEPHEGQNEQATAFSPQARIILLTILLCSTVLAMYTIFESFIDTIILAVLSGIAYVKLRQRFVLFMKKSKAEQSNEKPLFLKFLQTLGYLLLILIIPQVRYFFSQEFEAGEWKALLYTQINEEILSKALAIFLKANNIIKLVQVYLLLKIARNIFGDALQRLYFFIKSQVAKVLMKGDNSRNRVQTFLHNLFVLVFILAIIMLVIIFAGLFFECSSIVSSVGKTIEKYNNCTFYSLENDSDELLQCSSAISGSLKSYLPSIERKEQIAECIKEIQQKQSQYLNFTLIQHKKEICLIYQIVKEQSPQAIDSLFDIQVTKEYLLVLLRNIVKLLALTSDTIFSITTFISIFIMTVKSYTAAGQKFRLFGEHQNQLMGNITNLIYDYIMVTFKHVIFSLVVFEIFRFSDFNIVLSLVIGAVTLFPLISVSLVMLVLSALKHYLGGSENQLGSISAAICFVVFWFGSGRIFKQHFNKMDFNNTLVSLSAVFGLYRFGVAGIFYGPLVILLFICAYDALGKSKV